MTNITIIGTGLIGASLGMALRNNDGPEAPLGTVMVTGYDPDASALQDARGRLAIDKIAKSLAESVADAALVILAVPAGALRELLASLAPVLRAGTVVTDVTSTKAQAVSWARELLPGSVSFVGGHPMAGSEKSGAQAASPKLFEDAIYCLTPTATTNPDAIAVAEALVRQVRAKPYFIDATEHDHYVAGVSHLPFLLSALLMETTARSSAWREMLPLAATGFRDLTRLASGDVTMHRDICVTNRQALLRWLDETAALIAEVRGQLVADDQEGLLRLFQDAHDHREAWLVARPNMRPGETDFDELSSTNVPRPTILGGLIGRRPPPRK